MIAPRRGVTAEQSPVVDDDSPWPGLLAFREVNQRFFFGRTLELDDLFRRVRRETLTVLYAQSGLGKTSLLQAGLFPRLRDEGFLPVPIRLEYGDDAPGVAGSADPPGRQIALAIATAIRTQGLTGASDPMAAQGPWEYLHDVDFDLPDATGGLLVPVLVFDQLEELFTLGASRGDNGRFVARTVELLGDLVENRSPRALERAMRENPSLADRFTFAQPRYRVLMSLREDYLPHLHALRRDIPSIVLNNVRLTRFDRAQALEVVERPGAARQLVSPVVADAVVRAVAGQDGASDEGTGSIDRAGRGAETSGAGASRDGLEVDPSLLSLFCRQLNELRLRRGAPAITLELVANSSESVLHDFYVDAFRDLDAPREGGVKAFVEDFLLTSRGYRDRLSVERANEILVDRYHGKPEELNALVDRRLLHVEERGKTPQIELTHDVLAPIALEERTERVHAEELRRAEERRVAETRRAEEEERHAREEATAAAAELRVARRRQRVTMLLLALALVAAGLATWTGLSARRANARLRVSQRAADSASRAATQAAARALAAERTAVGEREAQTTLARRADSARVKANQANARSTAMLGDFCAYSLSVVNRFGDSTASNSDLQHAYYTLLALSDTSVDRMRARSPDEACPRQLDARVASIAANILSELHMREPSIERGRHGVMALGRLSAQRDPGALRIRVLSLSDLVHAFYFDEDYPDAVAAATQAIALGRGVDAAADSLAYDRLARVYHYGALAQWHLHRIGEAEAWIRSGVAVADSGIRRADQNRMGLWFTVSQLWLDQSNADTSQHHVEAAIATMRRAVDASRRRYAAFTGTDYLRWLAQMHGWRAEMARSLARWDEGLDGADSSIAAWEVLIGYGRRSADTSSLSDGLGATAIQLIGRSRSLLGLGRQPAAAQAAHAAEDTLTVLLRVQRSVPNMNLAASVEDSLANLFHSLGRRAEADSSYAREYALDSSMAYLPRADTAEWAKYHRRLGWLKSGIGGWAERDTAGSDSSGAKATLQRAADWQLRFTEQQVLVSRALMRRGLRSATTKADSSRITAGLADPLGQDLGSLSWYELLSGKPEQAVAHAVEGTGLVPRETWILVNQFNALVLSGRREEAKEFFAANARHEVETPAVPFSCAVDRDMNELWRRGRAALDHRDFVAELAAPYRSSCPKPRK